MKQTESKEIDVLLEQKESGLKQHKRRQSVNLKCANDEISSHDIWPFIKARFIRLRPFKTKGKVALRFELYYVEDDDAMIYNSRSVQSINLNKKEKAQCYQLIPNLSARTYITQLDCKRWVRTALNKAQIENSGFIKQGQSEYLCIFSTNNGVQSEIILNQLGAVGFGHAFGTLTISPIDLRRVTFFLSVCICFLIVCLFFYGLRITSCVWFLT